MTRAERVEEALRELHTASAPHPAHVRACTCPVCCAREIAAATLALPEDEPATGGKPCACGQMVILPGFRFMRAGRRESTLHTEGGCTVQPDKLAGAAARIISDDLEEWQTEVGRWVGSSAPSPSAPTTGGAATAAIMICTCADGGECLIHDEEEAPASPPSVTPGTPAMDDGDSGVLAWDRAPAPAPQEPATCPECEGSGRGEGTPEYETYCAACGGTGRVGGDHG